jgi:hypothetical protein
MKYCRMLLVISLLAVALILVSCTTSTDQTLTTVPTSTTQSNTISPNLVTMWHMDEGTGNFIYDATDNNNDALINGAGWVPGKKGSALSFDGENNWIMVTQTFILHNSTEATISFWINPADTSHRPIFWTRSDNSDLDRFHLFSGWDDQPRIGFDYRSPVGDLHDFVGIDVPLNQWTHIAITRSGNDYSFYRNGQLVDQITDANPSTPTYEGSWYIGRRETGGTFYKGLLDEIALYNRALSPEEILNIYRD